MQIKKAASGSPPAGGGSSAAQSNAYNQAPIVPNAATAPIAPVTPVNPAKPVVISAFFTKYPSMPFKGGTLTIQFRTTSWPNAGSVLCTMTNATGITIGTGGASGFGELTYAAPSHIVLTCHDAELPKNNSFSEQYSF